MLRSISVALVLLLASTFAQEAPHVVELHDSADVSVADVVAVFEKFGAGEEQVKPLLQKISNEGKAVVIAGTKESCEAAAALFEGINMKADVRPLDREKDLPQQPSGGGAANPQAAGGAGGGGGGGHYANSDVIEANSASLQEMMTDKSAGSLVVFFAPWCGPCKQMVPNVKKAATVLKSKGVRVAAINSDNEPGLAQKLGIRGFPSVKWVYDGKLTDYNGDRSSLDLVNFATTQNALTAVKAKVSEVVSGVKKVGKLAMSKVLNRAGVQPAQQPAAAAAA